MDFHSHSLRLCPFFTLNSPINGKTQTHVLGILLEAQLLGYNHWGLIHFFTVFHFSFSWISRKTKVCALQPAICVGLVQQLRSSRIMWNSTKTKGLPLGCPWKAVCKKRKRLSTWRKSKMKHSNSFDSYYRGTSDKTNLPQTFCKVLSSAFLYCWSRQLHAPSPSGSRSSLPAFLYSSWTWTFTCFWPPVSATGCVIVS